MLKLFVVLLKLSWLSASVRIGDDPIVKTKYGSVRGTIEMSLRGNEFLAFKSVPFARPPVGELRLEPPYPPDPWKGVLDVSKPPPYCVQPAGSDSNSTKGQEDCLYLSVYVPTSSLSREYEVKKKLPVMMFIHGGGYATGGGADYPPDYLMEKNIVYVSINYRLGALGFLGGLGGKLAGNFGFKDQSMALRWIHENIEAFGGDRGDVTIFGQSVGSVCVSLHAFNPLSKGLYHKAILESGTAISYGSLSNRENAISMTTAFAVVTGCQNKINTIEQLVICLRALPIIDFMTALSKLAAWYPGAIAGGVFLPCIEGEDVPGAALPRVPSESTFVSKNIQYMAGINSGEGTFLAKSYLSNNGQIIKALGADYQRYIPLVLALNVRSFYNQRTKLAESIKQFYFEDSNITDDLESAVALDQMFRDGIFLFSTVEVLKWIQTYNVSTYMYLYDYVIDCKDGWGCYDPKFGANHGDECVMLFPVPKIPNETYTYDEFSPREKNISTTLVDYWTNFAIYGDPNGDGNVPFWPMWNDVKQKYLHVTNTSYCVGEYVYEARFDFWKHLSDTFHISIE